VVRSTHGDQPNYSPGVCLVEKQGESNGLSNASNSHAPISEGRKEMALDKYVQEICTKYFALLKAQWPRRSESSLVFKGHVLADSAKRL
jgi:hypothetical protein